MLEAHSEMLDPAREGAASPTREVARESALSLIERKTALRILLIGTLALLALWVSEWSSGVIASHDRWAQPALVAFLAWQYVRLRTDPKTLLSAQRMAAGGAAVYCMLAMSLAALVVPDAATVPWLATNFMWLPVVSLLMHLTFPWRWAAAVSVTLTVLVALPAWWWLGRDPSAPTDQAFRSLLINGLLVQLTFLVCLIAVERFRHGIALIVAGDAEGPTDARQALADWLKGHTEALAQARDQAESASRAKSRFLAVMSHELRTPLHAMLVSSELLSDRPRMDADPEMQDRLLRTVRSSGQHLLSLIDQVLELSRIEAGEVDASSQPLDAGQVVHKAMAAVRPMAELKHLALCADVPADLPAWRLGDELRLTQVLINLLANACKFTQQGEVRLTVSSLDEPDQARGSWLRWTVTDTGPGMDEHQQSRVFDAFYQAERFRVRHHGGAGLGLTITRELVQLMGGRIALHSQPGRGTTIVVDLPLPRAAALPQGPRQVAPGTHSLAGVSVLVVDDDDVSRMLISEVLLGAEATVEAVADGPGALASLRQRRPSIVLMDWQMPGMDGLTTTVKIRRGEAGESCRDLPVIGLTANAFSEDRDACLAAGMNQVLTKPVTRQALLDEVKHWARAAT